jgi:signal transduction histidine kinase
MLTTIKLIKNSYYKLKIILTFCIVTIALVILMSRLSYVFIRNIYLAQMKEQVKNLTTAISKQINSTSLNMLEYGLPTKTTSGYFLELFKKNLSEDNTNSAFLFDDKFKVFIHSDQSVRPGKEETLLFLYRDEIFGIKPGFNSVTLPFKGDDGQWYLLGFYRLNKNFWVAIKESAQRLEKVEDFSKIFWFIGFGGTLLTIIMGWLLSRSITKPIDKLVSFSHQIGEGNFVDAVPKNLKGEIKVLSDAMQKMSSDLSKNQKEKENMLAQIAHEIRNPLGGIELLANLTKEDFHKGSIKEDYLNKILAEINGLKSLISSYLNYSRPTLASPTLTDIARIIEEVKDIFQKETNEKNVKFVLNLELYKIWFDHNHLRQILTNLISNSLEAIEMNGEIYIESYIKENKSYLSISDNGMGITQENLNHIFDPFYTTKKEGTGLGLSISQKLCLENQSQLFVESSKGKGTSFIVRKENTNEA